ncbi:MAG: Coenzyme F420 hydrogenase/dehydrogenase, beta subunit C-terminal domain [Bacteroidetes bacterium]|uniref:Coenzyme F420 hydrogenase/dehydrogenase, beta subunit C-terminal domain n=1 Tax=Candidatus Cryptobacteroides excrementavium TaxID=2840759 RepID=A0A9D9J445_9BACT|nr:Coenzyme F420 hydrogenase/dehydrogenase, beta subunit C-terminal domain [Candidatus Cryptobacteroides excrementavium]
MIRIASPEECCGCGACAQICPRQCITMKEDAEGFLYPQTDVPACIDCGLCEKTCPMLSDTGRENPLDVLAAINQDTDIRDGSSSGGVFTALAVKVIADGGVVAGAAFDGRCEVHHEFVSSVAELGRLRGSKYVQSRTENTFGQTAQYLKEGRPVLFSGTPCQIKALRLFLGREYPLLYTVETVCHGVPGPGVWRAYLSEVLGGKTGGATQALDSGLKVCFRDKSSGWKDYHVVIGSSGGENILDERHAKNRYMRLFLSDIALRPSCYACRAKNGRSGSDISIADYWGADRLMPEFYDDKGTSLVIINSEKGIRLFLSAASSAPGIRCAGTSLDDARKFNAGFSENVRVPYMRPYFFRGFARGKKDLFRLMDEALHPSLPRRLFWRLKRAFSGTGWR